mmetsp:Transcript_39332/g.111414  ORF Transcript_39332/g.111414 Transcript_39332/m.111414 type:complete len:1167 (-) Transcript_39332:153-3653(-)
MSRGRRSDDLPHARSDMSMDDCGLPMITIGLCAMEKKAKSKPMREIINRLERTGEFEVINFGDDCILNKPIEEWPIVQCLLSWFSEGFPLDKAQAYGNLRRPYLVNDLAMQHNLLDRRSVYKTLMDNGVSVPKHVVVSRTPEEIAEGKDPEGFEESEDYVIMNGFQINKPFVEKPVSGEDHNIYIYYPYSMGGGVKRLFRKVDDKSADYDPTHNGNVRRDGSYIYEVFLATGGTDVKVYTVGPRYAHAEARKSPVVDGRVQRAADGKEVRYPVLLSPAEKEIARLVSLAFGQKVCGFDLLRSEKGKSYVCDVNGWSFVKNSTKYYDDAAGLLRAIILSALAPHRLRAAPPQPLISPMEAGEDSTLHSSPNVLLVDEPDDAIDARTNSLDELRCVLAVIRHGDRTPKQKLKMKVRQSAFLQLLMRHIDSKGKQAKLKTPNQLEELLEVTLEELGKLDAAADSGEIPLESDTGPGSSRGSADGQDEEYRQKLRIVRTVLEQGGSFSGINRKAQLKPLQWSEPDADGGPARCIEALLILKHGGVLTHAGREQAEQLGLNYRMVMYPNQGGMENGLLRLHSTYRHDLKIYTSDEGRVQTSAAAFTKGLLDLEGSSLTPILVSLIKKDASMLDAFGKGASIDINRAKAALYHQITCDTPEVTSDLFAVPAQKPGSPSAKDPEACADESMNSSKGSEVPVSDGKGDAIFSDAAPGSPSQLQVDVGEPDGATATSPGLGTPSQKEDVLSFDDLNVEIKGLPQHCPVLLHKLVKLVQQLCDRLRDMCISDKSDTPTKSYSALTQDPSEWSCQEGQPCGGERILLMFDRWRKLLKSFYNPKTEKFDISKIPDLYDSIKYDAIHNSELGLDYKDIYDTVQKLATVVIPSEYGITGEYKLKIGSKICSQLLGKILADLQNMREESMLTAGMDVTSGKISTFEDATGAWVDPHVLDPPRENSLSMGPLHPTVLPPTEETGDGFTSGDEGDGNHEEGTLHRLCPTYANDVNSPLRHVRTRIYFTSESHIHSLINVLRYCHVGKDEENPLIGPFGENLLEQAKEKDYLTQIVFQMYENMRVPVDDPQRFRVEILFSAGSSFNPFEVVPMRNSPHRLPLQPRQAIHRDAGGVTLQALEESISPFSVHWTKAGASSLYYSHAASVDSATPQAQGSRADSGMW